MARSLLAWLAPFALICGVPAAADSDPGPLDRGQEIAAAACIRCHAAPDEEFSRNQQAAPLKRLAAFYPADLKPDAFRDRVKHGHPVAAELDLPQDDADALLAWLLSIQDARTP
jgi:mono/diheme cytochrome c family protein